MPRTNTASDPRWPRPGDLVYDSAANRTGVVAAVPGGAVFAYHLRPVGGGTEWTAPGDGTTLTRVEVGA